MKFEKQLCLKSLIYKVMKTALVVSVKFKKNFHCFYCSLSIVKKKLNFCKIFIYFAMRP